MESKRRPNVLWLTGDHFAFEHHRVLYPQMRLATYEHLCADGVEFDQAYTVCPLSTPARASMLTGMYPHRHGLLCNQDTELGRPGDLKPDQPLICHALNAADYRTVYFGKVHCGHEMTAQNLGFQEGWSLAGYGSPYVTPRYQAYLDELGLERPTITVDWDVLDRTNEGKTFHLGVPGAGFGPFLAAGRLSGSAEGHEAHFVAHQACRWLESQATDSEPFFLRVDCWGPHHPYHSIGRFAGMIEPASLQEYPGFGVDHANHPANYEAAMARWDHFLDGMPWSWWQKGLARCLEQAMVVDEALGRVLSTLERCGLADQTLVIYTADHGDLMASHGGYVNKDGIMVEETMRIPLAMRWPEVFAPGTTRDALVSNLDLPATVLDAVGLPEDDMPNDGRSLLDLCRDRATPWRDFLVSENHGEDRVEFVQRMVRHKQFKYIAHASDLDEFYDLANDPYEHHNAIADPQYAQDLATMADMLWQHMHDSDDHAPCVQSLFEKS